MRIRIGTCGNKVGLKKYVELFDTLEINATFYNFPSERTLTNWEKTFKERKDFALAFKAFQGLTHPFSSPTWHRAKIRPEERENLRDQVGCLRLNPVTETFLKRTLEMARRLSACFLLFQLPRNCEKKKESFTDFFSRLRDLSGDVPGLRFGLEIRWEDPGLLERLYRHFEVVPVFDPLLFPAYLKRFRDLPFLYLRLHGELKGGRLNYNKNYSDEELQGLAELVSRLGAHEVFVLFNNVYMHENALRFKELLNS